MTVGGKILITSKRTFAAGDSTSDILPQRKPVKGCYCAYNYNKNTKNKLKLQPTCTTSDADFWPCIYCKSNFDFKLTNLPSVNYENDYQLAGAPAFSCDTFKKISKINYTPTSEFLGNVKRKTSRQNSQISVLNVEQQTSIQDLSKKSSTAENHPVEPLEPEIIESGSELKLTKSNDSVVSEKNNNAPEIQTLFTSTTSYKNTSSSLTDNKLKKTISSSSDLNTRDEKQKFVKNLPRIVVQNNCRCSTCLIRDVKARNLSNCRQLCAKCGGKQLSLLSSDKIDSESDKETRELIQFRDKNYFDTHGSSRTLLSNASTAELIKHQLNDRLFSEPVDKENNLVVSIPLLSDDQLTKVIHYFPREIVRQYCKNEADTGEKKKKIQRKCPLTGHPINLYKFNRMKKPESFIISNNNINSLALNFQKKIT